MYRATAIGSPVRIATDKRPSAVSTSTCLLIVSRSRIVSATVSYLGDDPGELLRTGLPGLFGDHVERLQEAVPRAQRAGEDHEDVGELPVKLSEAFPHRQREPNRGNGRTDRGRDHGEQDVVE